MFKRHHLTILDLINQHALDLHSPFVQISMDGGGSFLKVVINAFDPNESTKSAIYMNSGIQRCQILPIVEDIPESNHNLRIILEKLYL